MRRILALALAASFFIPSAAHAAISAGGKCTKVGQEVNAGGKKFTCIKSGKNLVWNSGSSAYTYTPAFAAQLLAKAQDQAANVLSDANTQAAQASAAPNCGNANNSWISASIGAEPINNLRALVFENRSVCDIGFVATAAFLCPDGKVQKISNTINSSAAITLKASQKLLISSNISYYFSSALTQCALLTGYRSSTINIDSYHQGPQVRVVSSTYSGSFNQTEANKRAKSILAQAAAQSKQILADAKDPSFIQSAWDNEIAKAKEAKAAEDKAAQDKAAADKIEESREKCAGGAICSVGATGPGGGTIVYDAGKQMPWGRFLEMAPKGWNNTPLDPVAIWCDLATADLTSFLTADEKKLVGHEIGNGKANTDLMFKKCTSGAAILARGYRGGGKSDWYLPSHYELNAMSKQLVAEAPNPNAQYVLYWSSSQSGSEPVTKGQLVDAKDIRVSYHDDKTALTSVRPVRSF
jgi:hypothetical protein